MEAERRDRRAALVGYVRTEKNGKKCNIHTQTNNSKEVSECQSNRCANGSKEL